MARDGLPLRLNEFKRKHTMKTWMGLFLTVIMIGSATNTTAQNGKKPSLKVVCSVLAANITLTAHMPEGDKTAKLGSNPVPLTSGMRYTLAVSKSGYTPYRKSLIVDWQGLRQLSVVMEEGIGPDGHEPWVVDLENSVYMEFMPIPTGNFMMGSKNGQDDEQPVHKVTFSNPFWMAKTEVTQQQYGQFKPPPPIEKKKGVPMPMGAELPVIGISWNDATSFCKWLTNNERTQGRLPEGYEYTLPTEAEWEYACRAGSTTDYAGKIDSMGWTKKNSSEKTNLVGLKSPNEWGLHDMHGNVWEWCSDHWYFDYQNAPSDGSQRGLDDNEYNVPTEQWGETGNTIRYRNTQYRGIRGGAWNSPASACRSANRLYQSAGDKVNYLGFRPILIWNPPKPYPEVTRRLNTDQ